MNDPLDFDMPPSEELTDPQIFNLIWLQPRRVYRYIITHKYDKWVLILVILAGIASALENISATDFGSRVSLFAVAGISILIGFMFGWLSFMIYSALVSLTGKWIGGDADYTSILRVIAYAQIPTLFIIMISLTQLFTLGSTEMTEELFFNLNKPMQVFAIGLFGSELLLSLWSFILSVVGISLLQNFSLLKAVFNLVLPILIITIPLLILIFLLKAF